PEPEPEPEPEPLLQHEPAPEPELARAPEPEVTPTPASALPEAREHDGASAVVVQSGDEPSPPAPLMSGEHTLDGRTQLEPPDVPESPGVAANSKYDHLWGLTVPRTVEEA